LFSDPTIEGSYSVDITLRDKLFVVEVLDTAGQEEYAALRDNYIRRADGILLFYSIATRSSFEQCQKLRTNILKIKNDDASFPVMLVG
jgi:GTPase KRas protein